MKFRTKLITCFAVLVVIRGQISQGQECVRTGVCRCSMSDNSGEINLNSLASTNGAPRWTLDGGDKFEYSYNPCVGFSSDQFEDLAVHQVRINETYLEYDLGVQSKETFEYSLTQELSIKYTSLDEKRLSAVILVCDLYADEHKLEFVGELITTQYDFILIGPCACPGACDNSGIVDVTTTTKTTTTTTAATTLSSSTTTKSSDISTEKNKFYWNQVGLDLVSLIFHDLILVVVFGSVFIIVKFFVTSQVPVKSTTTASFQNKNFSNVYEIDVASVKPEATSTGNDVNGTKVPTVINLET